MTFPHRSEINHEFSMEAADARDLVDPFLITDAHEAICNRQQ
jgi:hypothetical protein